MDTETDSVPASALTEAPEKIPAFFKQIRERLKSHFIKTAPYAAYLHEIHPRDVAFLKKVNEIILTNISNENFDANALSREIALSRAQLLRKLKPLIKQSTGCYIKCLRLEKAKELLENENLSVSEVAYKTGFQTPSNFTKVFIQKYGIKPSIFCRSRPVLQMNK